MAWVAKCDAGTCARPLPLTSAPRNVKQRNTTHRTAELAPWVAARHAATVRQGVSVGIAPVPFATE